MESNEIFIKCNSVKSVNKEVEGKIQMYLFKDNIEKYRKLLA